MYFLCLTQTRAERNIVFHDRARPTMVTSLVGKITDYALRIEIQQATMASGYKVQQVDKHPVEEHGGSIAEDNMYFSVTSNKQGAHSCKACVHLSLRLTWIVSCSREICVCNRELHKSNSRRF